MSAWTPEPWNVVEDVKQELLGIVNLNGWDVCTMTSVDAIKDPLNAARLVAAVNGCAGLNPAAYRQVVEALKEVSNRQDEGSENISEETMGIVKQALTLAKAQS